VSTILILIENQVEIMGCSQSKSIFDKTSTENKELLKFENSWKLSQVPFEKIELYSRRNLSAPLIKKVELLNRLLGCAIPEEVVKNIKDLESFLIFVILLAKGTSKDKLRAVWLVFDKGLDDRIDKGTLNRLLTTVVTLAASASLNCFLERHPSALLQSWQQQLGERIESLSGKLLSHFIGEASELAWEDFWLRSQVLPQGRIWDFADVRTQLEHTQSIPKRFSNPFANMKLKKLET
jgi:hypothetical protein